VKDYFINIGGKDRRLVYTADDREAVERSFPYEGQPGNLRQLMQRNGFFDSSGGGSFEVQATILWAGLRHESPTLSVMKVKGWIKEHLTARRHIALLTAPAAAAVLEQGVLGYVVDISTLAEQEESGEGGKGPEPAAAVRPADSL